MNHGKKEMSFWEHLGELRSCLIRSSIAIVIGALLVGFNINWVMDYILFGPTRPDFPTFQGINYISELLFQEKTVALPEKFPIQVRKLFEQFNVMTSVSIVGGVVLAFPYITWELWRFISPALHDREQKNSLWIINATWVLFLLGVLCGYFLVMPFVIHFGYFFNISQNIHMSIDLSSYISVLLQVVLGMAVVFLFPIVVYLLTSMGILTPKFMRTYRRHAIVVIMIIAAVITPADVLSMMAVAFPLLLLYELSIGMCVYTHRRTSSQEKPV